MKKKIGSIFICMLVFAAGIVITATGNKTEEMNQATTISKLYIEQIDQQQSKFEFPHGLYYAIDSLNSMAQSFTPTMPVLTKIKLKIARDICQGPSGPHTTANLIVSIRSELDGVDLVTVIKTPNEIPDAFNDSLPIPTEQLRLVTIDFPDVSVDMGETYYIVCKLENGEYGTYGWFSASDTAYENGISWCRNSQEIWSPTQQGMYPGDVDFCFVTFGNY